jgi:hypothetical protein
MQTTEGTRPGAREPSEISTTELRYEIPFRQGKEVKLGSRNYHSLNFGAKGMQCSQRTQTQNTDGSDSKIRGLLPPEASRQRENFGAASDLTPH